MTIARPGLVRFVHSADLHLDSPFTGMRSTAPKHVADALVEATFTAYENIIELCIAERVDALLIAGDVYDGADRSLRAQSRFIYGLNRLNGEGIRSFVCHGNHDPLDGWEARLDYPPLCHRFGAEFEAVPVFPDDPARAVVHGISYPTRDVFDNLVARLDPVPHGDGAPYSIGLLHANVGSNPEHGLYAPCSLDDLVRSGVDYWALGHVHTRQVLSNERPAAVYPGNLQGRHPNETGARGVYLVEVDEQRRARLDFRPMDTVRWERLELDIASFKTGKTEQALIDRLHDLVQDALESADGRSLVLRITLTGRGPLHDSLNKQDFSPDALVERINAEWTDRTPFAWCERIVNATASEFNREERLGGSDFVADMLRLRDQSRDDSELLTRLGSGLNDLYSHREHGRLLRDLDLDPSEDELASMLDEAEAIAVDLLIGDDES